MTFTYEETTKGKTVGVNRNGSPVGYATRISEGRWTARVYIKAVPYDFTKTGFQTRETAVAFIAANGETPAHLENA